MKNQKGFMPIVIILVVLIGFVGVYFLGTLKNKPTSVNPSASPVIATKESSPSTVKLVVNTDPTSNWKTYTNIEYFFSFKYPNDWKQQSGQQKPTQISFETNNNLRFFVTYHPSYSITEWLEDTQAGKIIGKKLVGNYTYTVVEGGSLFSSLEYLLENRGGGFVRFVVEPNDNKIDSEKTFDQILSTFKFTN